MKILIVNTSERTGGAAVAAGRLVEALKNHGVKAKMLVRDKQTQNLCVTALNHHLRNRWRFVWERFVIWAANRFSRHNLFAIDIANTGTDITSLPEFQEADIIHLHWINQGMLSLKSIRKILASGKPVVWTMHDFWPCTGICHHPYDCEAFKTACQCCPKLTHPSCNDLSHRVFLKKQRLLQQSSPHFVAVSHWLAEQAAQSMLLKQKTISVIHNVISAHVFSIYDRTESRSQLQLPARKFIIAFGAARIDNPIKGFNQLVEALHILIRRGSFNADELHLVLFGTIKHTEETCAQIPVSYTLLGRIDNNDTLSRIYSAADVTVSASAYETFGQTLAEAQVCGCLPVSFGNSGQQDIITHGRNGYLASYPSTDSLADGIEWALHKPEDALNPKQLREDALKRFSDAVIARQYTDLYTNLLRTKHSS